MMGHVFLQQHAGLNIIVGSPMFSNKDSLAKIVPSIHRIFHGIPWKIP
jgi:hypothetical protein